MAEPTKTIIKPLGSTIGQRCVYKSNRNSSRSLLDEKASHLDAIAFFKQNYESTGLEDYLQKLAEQYKNLFELLADHPEEKKDAEIYLLKAIETTELHFSITDDEKALCELGYLYWSLATKFTSASDFATVESFMEKSIDRWCAFYWRTGNETTSWFLPRYCIELSDFLSAHGEREEAFEYRELAIEVGTATYQRRGTSCALYSLALTYEGMADFLLENGKPSEARVCFVDALDRYEEVFCRLQETCSKQKLLLPTKARLLRFCVEVLGGMSRLLSKMSLNEKSLGDEHLSFVYSAKANSYINKSKDYEASADEPGIYLPGSGGVRIEDFGVVTATGFEVFTQSPQG